MVLAIVHNSPLRYQKKLLRIAGRQQAQAFTFSPPRYHSIESVHKELMYALSGHEYILVGEFDENQRWHYHGVTIGLHTDAFVKSVELYGFCKFSGQPGIKWLEYIFKDVVNTMKILHTTEYPVFTPSDFKIRGNTLFPDHTHSEEAEPLYVMVRPNDD